MTQTIVGELASPEGLAYDRRPGFAAWATPASDYARFQGSPIPVTREHGGRACGELVYLERSAGGLTAVAHVDDSVLPLVSVGVGAETVLLESDLFWSAELLRDEQGALLLHRVAVTSSPARVGAKPLRLYAGRLDYRQVARERWELRAGPESELLTRAAVAYLDHRGGPLVIHERGESGELGLDGLHLTERWAILEDQHEAWKSRPLEIRPSRIVSVR